VEAFLSHQMAHSQYLQLLVGAKIAEHQGAQAAYEGAVAEVARNN
jgi:hypothetical protein